MASKAYERLFLLTGLQSYPHSSPRVALSSLNHRPRVWGACSAYIPVYRSRSLIVIACVIFPFGANFKRRRDRGESPTCSFNVHMFTLDSDARASLTVTKLVMIGGLCDDWSASVQVVTSSSRCRCLFIRSPGTSDDQSTVLK
jgi:hypothetical protein